MNTREEQIAEMAKDIYTTCVAIDGIDIAYGVFDNDDHFHRMANALYAAGYRKQSNTAREILKMLIGHEMEIDGWTWVVSQEDVAFIAKKYDIELFGKTEQVENSDKLEKEE